jgi:pimeloyl-ACP methyl ester carboxylesterase
MSGPMTHTLQVPSAVLGYDVRDAEGTSTAPVLMMIGFPMDASGFSTLVRYFPDRTVVTYDPRGVSRSERTDGVTGSTPDERADDLRRLISALDAGRVDIFASSGGAVDGLALVARHPAQVRTLVAHEPPAAQVLPDREQALAAARAIHETYLRRGMGPAMARFLELTSLKGPIPNDFADRPGPDPERLRRPARPRSRRLRAADGGRRCPRRSHAEHHRRDRALRTRLRRLARGRDPDRDRGRSRIRGRTGEPRGVVRCAVARDGSRHLPEPSRWFPGRRVRVEGRPGCVRRNPPPGARRERLTRTAVILPRALGHAGSRRVRYAPRRAPGERRTGSRN